MIIISKKWAVYLTAFTLTLSGYSAMAQQGPTPPKAKVRVAAAELSEMVPTLELPGTVVSLHNSRLAAETSATVDWVAEVGSYVKQGEAVARLNQRLLQLDLVNAEADFKRIKARLDYRIKEVKRLSKLVKSQSISESRFDEAFSQRDELAQQLKQAESRRDRIKYLLDKSVIRAPAPGWVVERYISVGEYVQTGLPVVRFVDTQNTEISVQAPLNMIKNLSKGMSITLNNDDKILSSDIRAIVPVGDNASRMVEIRIKNPEKAWIIGSAIRVNLPKASPQKVLTVPRDALIIRAGQSYIYKVANDGKAKRIYVRPGMSNATKIEIAGNISQGDKIVIRGGETLRPEQDVEILPAI